MSALLHRNKVCRARRARVGLLTLGAIFLLAAQSSSAAVLGSDFANPSPGLSQNCSFESCTHVQTRLDGRVVRAPFNGTITRWRLQDATGEFRLQSLRKRDDGSFKAIRTTRSRTADGGRDVFDAHLPLRRRDFVAVRMADGANIKVGTTPGCRSGFVPGLDDGESAMPHPSYSGCDANDELFMNARLRR